METIVLETCLAYENTFQNNNLFVTAESLKTSLEKQKHERLSLEMESMIMAIFNKFQGKNRQKTVKRGEFCS